MPPFVRFLIALCVGVPAVLARIIGMLWACYAGVLLLIDPETLSSAFGLPPSRDRRPELLAIALAISIIGYLMDVGVAYINSEHRQAVPPRRVAVLITAELSFQLLGIAAACCLIAAAFGETTEQPWGHPAVVAAGVICGLAALFLMIRFRQSINDWRAAWKGSASADIDLNR